MSERLPNSPRFQRDRYREAKIEKGVLAFGCFALLLNILFWGAVIFVAIHFITKYW